MEFVFIYAREEHENLLLRLMPPNHLDPSGQISRRAAALQMRRQFHMERQLLFDDDLGSLQRRVGNNPNATFVIGVDRQIALMQNWTHGPSLDHFLEEFLDRGGVRQTDLIQKYRSMPLDLQKVAERMREMKALPQPMMTPPGFSLPQK